MTVPAHSDVVALASALVACPSVNPAGRVTDEPPYGEGRMADLLEALLCAWGATVERQEVSTGRSNVIARFAGARPGPVLLFEAHMDTVPVSDMSIPPFTPEVREGRLYGRGSCDTKGPMAAMLMAIRRVLDEDGALPVTLVFAGACDEEMGASGSRALAALPGLHPTIAVVAEPTDLAIIHAHKGTIRWRLSTQGVAAHSSAPERGVNAIYQMMRVIAMIEAEMIPRVRLHQHPLLGTATISVGTIQGGTQANVVPAGCAIDVDRRLLPGETPEAATAEMRAQLDALVQRTPGLVCTLEILQFYEPFEMDQDAPPCRIVAQACRAALGGVQFATAPWSADAGVMAATGMPCVLIGPGSIRQAHTHDEFIELTELKRGVDVYAAIIRQMAMVAD